MKSIIIHQEISTAIEGDMPNGAAIEHLRALCGLGDQNPDHTDREIQDEASRRLEQELSAIESSGTAAYFYILGCLGQRAADRNRPIHVRGIAAGSIVLHKLGLSRICPVEFQLTGEQIIGQLDNWPIIVVVHAGSEVIDDAIETIEHRFGEIEIRVNESPLSLGSDAPFRIDFIEEEHLETLGSVALLATEADNSFRLNSIPLNDEATLKYLAEGKVTSCPAFNNDFLRTLLMSGEPQRFEHLISALALQRPETREREQWAPVLQSWNKIPSPFNHEVDRPEDLKETGGTVLFSEQILSLLTELGNVTIAQGDRFLKACLRDQEEVIYETSQRFLSTAGRTLGIEAAGELFQKLKRAARTAEWKCHLAQRAYVSYITAYLEVHFPTQFQQVFRGEQQ